VEIHSVSTVFPLMREGLLDYNLTCPAAISVNARERPANINICALILIVCAKFLFLA
jgi:hypothetical protein